MLFSLDIIIIIMYNYIHSYGTNWGINGYMMMLRNGSNMCGIASDAGFPII